MNQHHKWSVQSLLRLSVILVCLAGVVLSQTFQYSRGWTNGKKRSGTNTPQQPVIPFVFQETSDGQEVLGICQMQRLKELLQGRRRDQAYLPCDTIWKYNTQDPTNDDVTDRYRRKGLVDQANGQDQLTNQELNYYKN